MLYHSSTVIDHLETDQSHTILAYHYFDFRDSAKQTFSGLLASLLLQLAQQSRVCHELLKQLRLSASGHGRPDDRKLLGSLETMLDVCGPVFIVVDALDECTEAERDHALPRLRQLVRPRLHLLVTSRPESDIKHYMKTLELATHSLSLQDAALHSATLKAYVSTQLHLSYYKYWSDDVKEKALQRLVSKSNGM